jgi:hypothetical protein
VKALDQTEDLSGFRPNKIVFGKSAWRLFQANSIVNNRLFPLGGAGAGVTLKQAAEILTVDEIQVAAGYYNSSQGTTATLVKFLDDAVLGFFSPSAPFGPEPRAYATMRWSVPGIPNMAVEALPFDAYKKSEFIEVGVYDDEKVLDANLAFMFKGCNSAQANGLA